MSQILPRWMKLKDAQKYCGLHERTIRRHIDAGLVKSKMVKQPDDQRGVRVVDRESLDAFIEGCDDKAADVAFARYKRNQKGAASD